MRVYPRVCGGTYPGPASSRKMWGLSPRVRGNPAIAAGGSPNDAVYPRVCGGTDTEAMMGNIQQGLSPRVRGNRSWRLNVGQRLRSIPACAGEPIQIQLPGRGTGVYPRVCGGTYNAAL